MKKEISLIWQDTTLGIRTALRSSVAKNAASLYVIQFANYILPLITVPYLVRILGPAGYGKVAFGLSLIGYFMLFVDYGFGLSATRKISVKRSDPIAVSHTVFNVWAAKTLLCIAGFLVLLLLVTFIPKLHEVALLLLILYGTVIGNVLFPVWLFQGMEKMVSISVINLVMRLLVVIGIFTLIHRPEHYLLYAGLTSLGAIGAGLVGVGVAFYMFKLRLIIPTWRVIREELVEGWMLFLSMASVSLYTVGNAFILGLLTNHMVVGYYSAAEKIVKAVLGLLGPISQAAYPRFSKMASESKELVLQWGQRMLVVMGSLSAMLAIALFTMAPVIVRVVLSSEFEPSISVVRILSPIIFLIGIATVWSTLMLIPFHYDRAVMTILFIAGVVNISSAVILAPFYHQDGMAAAVLLSELFVNLSTLVYSWRHGVNPLCAMARR